jgi:hypothetical protein
MQARAAGARSLPSTTSKTTVDDAAAVPIVSPSVGRSRPRVAARVPQLSREEEYRYIRSDMNRLLVTAGSLLALMIVLLLVLGR